jgi:adhesin transport system membrane fusion protein
MVERGIRSQVDFLKLQREESDSKQKLSSALLAVPKLQSEISEIEKRIDEAYETYDAEIRAKLNETIASFKELEATSSAYEDQVSRTTVKAPSNGIVQNFMLIR